MTFLPLFDTPKALTTRTGIVPRDYQREAILNAINSWELSPGALVRLLTGGGKTLVGSLIIDQWLQLGDNFRAFVLVHEIQLMHQFAQELNDVLGIQPDLEQGSRHHATGQSLITIASRQSLGIKVDGSGYKKSRLYKFDNELNWLVVIDEAHRYKRGMISVEPIIDHFEKNPKSRRLGLTATPERTDGVTLEHLFPTIASDYRLYSADGDCAVNDGWAVEYDQRFVTVEGVDFKDIKKGTTKNGYDYTDSALEEMLGEKEQLSKLIDPTLELVGDRQTLIFSPTVAMAKAVALQINADKGCDIAVSIHGKTPHEERNEAYKAHQSGKFQFLSVCALCREGYNDPNIAAVAIFRPTKSKVLAEQMKGRGCRTLRGTLDGLDTAEERIAAIAASDKKDCMIVDLVGVTGLADCATTAHIFGAGQSDEVIDWANQLIIDGDETNVRKALDQAEKEVEEENRRKAQNLRLLKEEEERLKAERLAEINATTRWKATKVKSGGGGVVLNNSFGKPLATPKQLRFLDWKGVSYDPDYITKGTASRMIGQLKKGMPLEQVRRTNRTKPPKKKVQPEKVLPLFASPGQSIDDINRMFDQI